MRTSFARQVMDLVGRRVSRVIVLSLVALAAFGSQTLGRLLVAELSGVSRHGRAFQTDLVPVIVAAKLYDKEKIDAIYSYDPDSIDPDWLAEERALPSDVSGTAYPYTPVYLLPFSWLVRALQYRDIVDAMAVLNVLLAISMVSYLAVRITDRFPLQLAITCTFALAQAVEVPILLGQNFLVTLLFTAGFVIFDLDRRRGLAVMCLVLAAITKPWAPMLMVIPLLRRDYRMASLATFSLIMLFSAQYAWNPELTRGYLELVGVVGSIDIIAHNNMSLSAAMHRLSLIVAGDPWHSWEQWRHVENAPWPALRYGLGAGALLVGWIARGDVLKAQSVLIAMFLVASVYWDFYALMLVPLVLSTILSFEPTRESSPVWQYAVCAAFIAAVFIGSSFRPWMGPWSRDEFMEIAAFEATALDAIKSLTFLALAAAIAGVVFPGRRFAAFLLVLGTFLTYSLPGFFVFCAVNHVMSGSESESSVKVANALVTFIPSVLFVSCFLLQCRRERLFERGWHRRLVSFRSAEPAPGCETTRDEPRRC